MRVILAGSERPHERYKNSRNLPANAVLRLLIRSQKFENESCDLRKKRRVTNRSKPYRPGWSKSIRREAKTYPDVFPQLRWVGRPTGTDSFHLVGMTLELVWYLTKEDRQRGRNEIPVSLISFDSCVESKVEESPLNESCVDIVTRCDCDLSLVELVDRDSLYGQWSRRQTRTGPDIPSDLTELITKLRVWFTIGIPKRAAIQDLSLRGVRLLPNVNNLLDIRVVEPPLTTLGSLQVDRLTELFEESAAYIPQHRRLLQEREAKRVRLKKGIRKLEQKQCEFEASLLKSIKSRDDAMALEKSLVLQLHSLLPKDVDIRFDLAHGDSEDGHPTGRIHLQELTEAKRQLELAKRRIQKSSDDIQNVNEQLTSLRASFVDLHNQIARLGGEV